MHGNCKNFYLGYREEISHPVNSDPNFQRSNPNWPQEEKYAWKLQEFLPGIQRGNQPSCEFRSKFPFSLCLQLCVHEKGLWKHELSIEAVSLLSAALMLGRNYQLSDDYVPRKNCRRNIRSTCIQWCLMWHWFAGFVLVGEITVEDLTNGFSHLDKLCRLL